MIIFAIPLLLISCTKKTSQPFFTINNDVVGIWGPMELIPNHESINASIIDHIEINPLVEGEFEWKNDSVYFFPAEPLADHEYYFTIDESTKDKTVFDRFTETNFTFRIRQPEIIIFSRKAENFNLSIVDTKTKIEKSLTNIENEVFDYSVSKDGNAIAYSLKNDKNGFDIWVTDHNLEEKQLLIACGEFICQNSAWSPDGNRIAYRKFFGGGVLYKSIIEVFNLYEGQVKEINPLRSQSSQPSWSPDGNYLGFFDGYKNAIVIKNLITHDEQEIFTNIEQKISWSADSARIAFVRADTTLTNPYTTLNIADLEDDLIYPIDMPDGKNFEYSSPIWVFNKNSILYSKRNLVEGETRQIYLLDLNSHVEVQITDAQDYEHASYHLDPLGEKLVYQRLFLSKSDSEPEVVVINIVDPDNIELIVAGALPNWIP